MLQKMRDQTQSLGFKVLVGIIVFVLAVFGFGAFNLFVTGDPEVASVNGEGITQNELAIATQREQRRIAARMGENFDPAMLDSLQLQGRVLDQIIAQRLLGQAATDYGVAVSDARVNDTLVGNPSFQVAGRFEGDVYRQAVQSMGYTPQGFMDETAQMLALEQLQTAIADTAFLTRRELNVHASLLAQRRDVAYLPFDVDRFRDQVTVTDDEVRLRYEENSRQYVTEESVDVAYVSLSLDKLADSEAVEVEESALRAAYEREREEAPKEEERRSRHILLETGDDRSPEEAEQRLQELAARIESGEPFADVAREVSEDAGSAAQGGDLGFAGRGVFDPAFEEALFALEQPGDVSEPVATEFGYHLIQLEEIRTNPFPEFETMRAELEQRLRREQAAALFDEQVRELDSLAFENPNDLQAIQDQLGLEVRTVDGVTRQSGPPPFDDPQLRQRVFSDEVLGQGFNSAAVELGDGQAVVARVAQRHPSQAIPLDEVAADIRDEIEFERATRLAEQAHTEARQKLEGGASAAEVADEYTANWQTFEGVRRNATEVPRSVLQTAFDLPRPGDDGKSIGEATLPTGGLALVTVTRVEDGVVSELTEAELRGMRGFLADRVSRLEFGALYQTLQEQASIQRPDAQGG